MTPQGLEYQQTGTSPSLILVVDDEELARRMMIRAISAAGHICSSTGSGEEAINLLQRHQFDLAVVDKNLPDIDGLEVTRRARSLRQRVPVIVVTGFPSEESERDAIQLGAARYLIKPFESHQLQSEVWAVLQNSWEPFVAEAASESLDTLVRTRTTAPPGNFGARSLRLPDWAPLSTLHPSIDLEDTNITALVVEADPGIRTAIVAALKETGCHVTAFQSRYQAEVHVRYVGYDMLIARPEILRVTTHWKELVPGAEPLGSIAIAVSGALAQWVKSIQEGARGMFVPPYDAPTIGAELRTALALIRDLRPKPRTTPPSK